LILRLHIKAAMRAIEIFSFHRIALHLYRRNIETYEVYLPVTLIGHWEKYIYIYIYIILTWHISPSFLPLTQLFKLCHVDVIWATSEKILRSSDGVFFFVSFDRTFMWIYNLYNIMSQYKIRHVPFFLPNIIFWKFLRKV